MRHIKKLMCTAVAFALVCGANAAGIDRLAMTYEAGKHQGGLSNHSRVLEQREAYRAAVSAIKSGDTERARAIQSSALKGYPLSVYIDYYLLAEDPSVGKFPSVMRFIKSGRHGELSDLLRMRYADYLADLGQYQKVSELIGPQPMSEAQATTKSRKGLLCRFYEANWNIGHGSPAAIAYATSLYKSSSGVPQGCQGLISTWTRKGYLTPQVRMDKFTSAYMRVKGEAQARREAAALKGTPLGSLTEAAMRHFANPGKALAGMPASSHDLAVLVFKRYAVVDPTGAARDLGDFEARFRPTATESIEVRQAIAQRLTGRTRSLEEVRWADRNLPMAGWTEELLEQRLRRAIWFAEWKRADQILSRMGPEFKSDTNWRYWEGRVALENGRKAEGQRILAEVAKDRSFFGFLAAQTLGQPMPFNEMRLPRHADLNVALSRNSAVHRFFELYALDDRNASLEWREVAKTSSDEDALVMSEWALRNGLTRYAIDSVVASQRWDALAYRFPAPYMDIYRRNSKNQNVPLSFLYGISRQESMMNPVVRSPVGAVGLMQLMPGTAKLVSRQNGWKYQGTSQLTDPSVNVRLGTAYLRDMLGKFGNNRVLAAAAYNAGPQRVYQWASNDSVKRDAAMYVENIPFAETRKYVQNVLLYDTIYNKLLNNR
nr:transglycosylase SLT domain-containing protein [Succinivibrionaceae bacterium]